MANQSDIIHFQVFNNASDAAVWMHQQIEDGYHCLQLETKKCIIRSQLSSDLGVSSPLDGDVEDLLKHVILSWSHRSAT